MSPLPEGRREVRPSKHALGRGRRRRPSFGPSLNVSVPISFGLPLLAVGLVLVAAALTTGLTVFWIFGAIGLVAGALLFASGKRL